VCEFESSVEGVHAVHAAQPQLLHETSCVLSTSDAELLARCVGLSGGEHTAHGARDVDMHGCRMSHREQSGEQLIEQQMPTASMACRWLSRKAA
jgi:hypothetical protein